MMTGIVVRFGYPADTFAASSGEATTTSALSMSASTLSSMYSRMFVSGTDVINVKDDSDKPLCSVK